MPTTVASNSSTTAVLIYQNMRKAFYAAGRYWLFFSNSSNIGYKSSADNITWENWVPLGIATSGNRISIYWDGTYIHYARTQGINPAWYRRGIPQSDGNINWESAERIASPLEAGISKGYPTIAQDSSGYPWIAFSRGNTDCTRVVRATSQDGSTWGSDTALDPQSTFDTPTILALLNNKMYCIWVYYGNRTLRGKFYDGTSWDTSPTSITSSSITNYGMYAALVLNDTIYLVYSNLSTSNVYVQTWTESQGWSDPVLLEDSYRGGDTIPTISRHNDQIYVFWLFGGSIYYRVYTGSWQPRQLFLADALNNYAIAVFEHSIENKIGMAWVKTGSYLVRFDYLRLSLSHQLFEALTFQPNYRIWQLNVLGLKKNAYTLLQRLGAKIKRRGQQENS